MKMHSILFPDSRQVSVSPSVRHDTTNPPLPTSKMIFLKKKHLELYSFHLLKFDIIVMKNQVSAAANLIGILQRDRNKFPALRAHSLSNKGVKQK